MDNIVSAIAGAMTTPEAADQAKQQGLQQLLSTVVQMKHMGAQRPGMVQPGQQPGAMAGGGTNLRQLMGGAPAPPSAGTAGGPTGSGASADALRQMVQAGQAAS